MSIDLSGPIAHVEKIAKASKVRRMLYSPGKYFYAILYRKLLSHFFNFSTIKKVDTFFKRPIFIQFPAGTDIYLSGGKTDDAELRLTKFLMRELTPGDQFIDIGAHFGYYSLLASSCVGNTGNVIAIEPSRKSYALLQMNTKEYPNITALNMALADKEGTILFYGFPHIYSEYSSAYPEQFKKQKWFRNKRIQETEVRCNTVDSIVSPFVNRRTILKIDTEGSEHDILRGATHFLQQDGIVIMEYLAESRHNANHKLALGLLTNNGYGCFRIDQNGALASCEDAERYLTESGMESDNLVFKKQGTL